MGWRCARPFIPPLSFLPKVNCLSSGQNPPARHHTPWGASLSSRPFEGKEKGTNFYGASHACHVFGVPNTGLFSSTPHPPLRFHTLASFSSVGSQRAEALYPPAENKGPSGTEKQSKQTNPPARSRDPAPPALNLRLQPSRCLAPRPRPGLSRAPPLAPRPALIRWRPSAPLPH